MNLKYLENILLSQSNKIDDWFKTQEKHSEPSLYSSLDIRNAGFKCAHVDANLFPAGFNNFSPNAVILAAKEIKNHLAKNFPQSKKVLLVPENFTRNLKYLDNLYILKQIFKSAGLEVLIGSPYINSVEMFDKPHCLKILPLKRINDLICTENDWYPDLIVLNNDLTDGLPPILLGLKQQQMIPNPLYGWYRRRKSFHFQTYDKITNIFAKEFDFDPWFITTFFTSCRGINFKQKIGLNELANTVDEVIKKASMKYEEYNIKSTPYAYIKSDLGTYGMGIISVSSGGEILSINKKNRHSMQTVKYGMPNEEIFIQEGIPTTELHENNNAETMCYLINGEIIESFYRTNNLKDNLSNLNSRGMSITRRDKVEKNSITFTIAKLASLAVSLEMSDLKNTNYP